MKYNHLLYVNKDPHNRTWKLWHQGNYEYELECVDFSGGKTKQFYKTMHCVFELAEQEYLRGVAGANLQDMREACTA